MKASVYKYGLHYGEEDCISGNDCSGMIYFSGCHLRCSFCYSKEINHVDTGKAHSQSQFLDLLYSIKDRGARNLNLIAPTHVWNTIEAPLQIFKEHSSLPILLKTSGYQSASMTKRMAKVADVLVPDFKVYSPEVAKSVHLPTNYGALALESLKLLLVTHGTQKFTLDGKIRHGIVIRHLLMPKYFQDTFEVVKAIASTGFEGPVNLMNHFIDPEIGLTGVSSEQLTEVLDFSHAHGLHVLVNGKVEEGLLNAENN